MTTGTNTAATRSASRCTGALPVCAASTSRAICASAVSAPDPGGPHDEPSAGVHGRAGHRVARADLDRDRLAGEQAGVHRGRALLDHAVGGDLLAGPDHEPVADGQLLDRERATSTPSAQHGDILGAEVEQGPQRGTGAPLGAGLEVPAEQDERGDAGGDLEVDAPAVRLARTASARSASACRARRRRPRNSAYSDQPGTRR